LRRRGRTKGNFNAAVANTNDRGHEVGGSLHDARPLRRLLFGIEPHRYRPKFYGADVLRFPGYYSGDPNVRVGDSCHMAALNVRSRGSVAQTRRSDFGQYSVSESLAELVTTR